MKFIYFKTVAFLQVCYSNLYSCFNYYYLILLSSLFMFTYLSVCMLISIPPVIHLFISKSYFVWIINWLESSEFGKFYSYFSTFLVLEFFLSVSLNSHEITFSFSPCLTEESSGSSNCSFHQCIGRGSQIKQIKTLFWNLTQINLDISPK